MIRPVSRISRCAAFATLAFLTACSCSSTSEPVADPSRVTTTKPAGPVVLAPLTGAPAPRPELLGRPALAVKIDNSDSPGAMARPQLGITTADVVYEERVEGTITRLLAVFHSVGSDPVGPIRSARTTDLLLLGALQRPMFAWSGANAIFAERVRNGPLIDVGADALSAAYSRRNVGGHVIPHNLYANTTELWAAAPADATPPKPLFHYRKTGASPGAGARAATWVHVDFGVSRGAPADWKWDGVRGRYLRYQSGTAHVDEKGTQVTAANVVVQFVDYVSSGVNDSAGNPIPEAALVGTGKCWVFTGGRVVSGTWTKTSADAITTYTDAAGDPIGLAPGQTWVELPSPGGAEIKQ